MPHKKKLLNGSDSKPMRAQRNDEISKRRDLDVALPFLPEQVVACQIVDAVRESSMIAKVISGRWHALECRHRP
jgi:hypothetical protein